MPRRDPNGLDAYTRALHVLSLMRAQGLTLDEAAPVRDTTPESVIEQVGEALHEDPDGEIRAEATDQLERTVQILTPRGLDEVTVRGPEEASRIARYWNAVRAFAETGKTGALDDFQGERFRDADGRAHRFVTDRLTLRRLAAAGELSFESLYVRKQ